MIPCFLAHKLDSINREMILLGIKINVHAI